MLFFKLKMQLRILVATLSTFGVGKELFNYSVRRPLRILFNDVTLFLDNIFFPSYRSVDVKRPIFIIGHPRSGSTFLHRLLTQTDEYAVFRFWEIAFPSLTARKIVRPLIQRLVAKQKDTIFPKEVGHELKFSSVEEEEVLFDQWYNTQFVNAMTPLAFGSWDFAELVYSDRQPQRIRDRTLELFRQCLQRQIYYTGKEQIITKMNYSGLRIRSLLHTFPDAKIIYLVRSPYETIPSHLSLHRNIFDYTYGLQRIPATRLRHYYERRYYYNVEYYRYVERLLEDGAVGPSQVLTVSYDMLLSDLRRAISLILEFTGLQVSEELRRNIDEVASRQGTYRRKHENLPLEEFGLTREKIAQDLGFVFAKYGFPK
jgi:hypothetical protein